MGSILKQSAWLFFAQGFGRTVGFFYNIYLANALGISGFGLFSVALAYYYILSSIAEFGFNRYLVREIARDSSKIAILSYNVNLLRFIFSLGLIVLLALFLQIFNTDSARFNIILLTSLAIIPQAIAQTIDSIFVAVRKLQYSALSTVILSLSNALFGIYLVSRVEVLGAAFALILGQLCYLTSLYFLTRTNKFKLGSKINFSLVKEIFTNSSGYGLLAIIGLISFRLDTIILSHIRGNFETGLYSAAYKFFEAIAFAPASLAIALFPVAAQLHSHAISNLKQLFIKSFKVTVFVGIISALAFYFIVPEIIRYLLPNYVSSTQAVQILAFAIPFIFIHIPANQILLSTEKYLKPLLVLYGLLLFINVVDYFVLIYLFGFKGAAWGTVISEMLTFLVLTSFLQFKVFREKS